MLVKFGSIITDGRGSIGGHTLSRNTYGPIMRTKVTPVNRATTAQQNVRSSLTAIAQMWRGLTDAQRAAWASLAQEVSRTNVFGDSVKLTAFNLFTRLNRNIAAVNGTLITAAPAIPTMSALTAISVTAAAGTPAVSVVFAPTPVPTGFDLLLRATPLVSAGISFVKSEFRQLAVVAAAGASPSNQLSNYNNLFGTLIAGKRLFVTGRLVHIASGFSSVDLQATCIVSA